MKRLCVETFSVYTGANVTPKYIYPHLFFSSFFPKLRAMDTCDEQFCKPTDMPMYFSVFPGQKHAAYCEFYLSLCTYGNMTQYAVQLFCFLGVSTVRMIPPLSDGGLTLTTFSTAVRETQNVGKPRQRCRHASTKLSSAAARRRRRVADVVKKLRRSRGERGSLRHDKHPVSYFLQDPTFTSAQLRASAES